MVGCKAICGCFRERIWSRFIRNGNDCRMSTMNGCFCWMKQPGPAMARLAEIQRDYGRQTEEVLQLAGGGDGDGSSSRDRAEAMTLYAEFAIKNETTVYKTAMVDDPDLDRPSP